jgi:hypothetical protein
LFPFLKFLGYKVFLSKVTIKISSFVVNYLSFLSNNGVLGSTTI